MWWYPSGRFPNTCRERFNLAGARKEMAEALKGSLSNAVSKSRYK